MEVTDRVIAALRRFYGDVLYTRDGATYPMVVRTAPPGSQPDDLLGMLTPDRRARDTFAVYDETHLQARRESRQMIDGLCYNAHHLSGDPLRLSAEIGGYFDMMATCDALDHEMRAYGRGERDDLPLREAFHRAVSPAEALTGGAGRSATVGAAVLTVFNDGRTYRAIIVQRSARMATGAGLLHVLPAFVVQPIIDARAEWSFGLQTLREYGEELFAMPEHEDWTPAPTTPDYFMLNPHVAELRAMLDDGRAQLHATGITQNLLSTRFELCGLLVIHDAEWHNRNADALRAALHTERQATYYAPLDALDSALPDGWRERFTPQGIGALWLGLDRVLRG